MHLVFIFKKARSTVEASMHDAQCVFKKYHDQVFIKKLNDM